MKPWQLIENWWREAEKAEPDVFDAMQLATNGAYGPTCRTVLCRTMAESGLIFFTNYNSRKAADIEKSSRVSGVFHWKSLQRQLLFDGTATKAPAHISDTYWEQRPRGSKLGAWASNQSEEALSPIAERLAKVEAEYEGQEVPRPSHWGGYIIDVDVVELWQGKADRLHDRFLYTRGPNNSWTKKRLDP